MRRSQSGLTLIEVLLALFIAAVVLTPLAAGFITMVDGSSAAREELDRTADAARIGNAWTRDVQSVDVGGVNGEPPCPDSSGSGGVTDQELVTFSWNSSSSAAVNGPPRSATWVVSGTGADLELIRRYCEAGVPVSQTTLASHIGVDGVSITNIVKGPGTDPTDFCPPKNFGTSANPSWISDSCTIVVDGDLQYRLTVARRAPERAGDTPAPLPPPPPTILVSATQARNTYITVGWTPPTVAAGQPAIDSYRVNVYDNAGGNGAPVASSVVSGTSAVVEGLTNLTDYYVRVQARNVVGWGEPTAAYGPLTPDSTAPDAAAITGTPVEGDTTITVTWQPNANNGGSDVTTWTLIAQPGSGAAVTATVTHSGAQNAAQTGTISGLTNGVSYTVTVVGNNGKGPGLSSPPSGSLIPYGVPGVATNLQTTANSDGTVTLTWVPPADNGGRPITGYRVIVDNGPAAGPWPSASTWYPAGTTTATLNGLTLGSQYTFRVLTNNLRGFSTSGESEPPILSATLPSAPPSVTVVQSGSGGLVVNWTAAAPNGSAVIEYQVRSVPVISGTPRNVSGLTTTFTGLSSGQTYTFYVRARNVAGWGPERSASGIAGGIPNWNGAVPTVSRQSGNNYPFAVNVAWSRPSNTGGLCITAYRVEYSTNNSTWGSSQTITGTPNSSCGGEPGTTLGWTGIEAGAQTRWFRVVAINSLGESLPSGPGTIAPTATCSVIATEDSWVNDDDPVFSANYRDDNYGGDGNLRVDKSSDSAFIKFDPRSNGSSCTQFGQPLPAAASIVGGDVQLYNNNPTGNNRDHTISRVTGNWSEYGITFDNKPGTTNDSDTESAEGSGWKTWAVYGSDIQLQRSAGSRFGWNIRDTGGSIWSDWATYDSREKPSKPTLRIVFY
jgi:hypothetical protein